MHIHKVATIREAIISVILINDGALFNNIPAMEEYNISPTMSTKNRISIMRAARAFRSCDRMKEISLSILKILMNAVLSESVRDMIDTKTIERLTTPHITLCSVEK